jgi:DNA-binding Lrp family transcriptional regulator
LQQDSRLSFKKIADKTGISIPTAFNRVRKLESNGVLKGYTVKLDSVKLGYDLTMVTLVQVEGEHLTEIEDEISKVPNVLAIYDLMGEYDAAIISRFKDKESLNAFRKNVLASPHVRRALSNIVSSIVKEDLKISLLNGRD